jgi:hypothetical protein
MEKNMGMVDRVIRAVLAIGFLILGFKVSYWFFAPALIMAATTAVGVCPLYMPLGIRTNGRAKGKRR